MRTYRVRSALKLLRCKNLAVSSRNVLARDRHQSIITERGGGGCQDFSYADPRVETTAWLGGRVSNRANPFASYLIGIRVTTSPEMGARPAAETLRVQTA